MLTLQAYKIWVLAPQLITADENIDYYYDFKQSIDEYKKVFAELNINWQWQPVTIENFKTIIAEIKAAKGSQPLVLNLCDGDEINATPGISVIDALEQAQIPYTGAHRYFYDITTSKIFMKQAFDKAKIVTPAWKPIYNLNDIENAFSNLVAPLIIKPAISGGSMGVGIKNVVENANEMFEIFAQMHNGYRGWNLSEGGIIAEEFIAGREFTSFITGTNNINVYEPVERIFHESLPEKERFLSFDRLWEIYEDEKQMPNEENFYEYAPVDKKLAARIKLLSAEAYKSLEGSGYTRIDIRMNKDEELFVLEANAQCGLSNDENFTSIGAILKVSNISFTQAIAEILNDGLLRFEKEKKLTSKLEVSTI